MYASISYNYHLEIKDNKKGVILFPFLTTASFPCNLFNSLILSPFLIIASSIACSPSYYFHSFLLPPILSIPLFTANFCFHSLLLPPYRVSASLPYYCLHSLPSPAVLTIASIPWCSSMSTPFLALTSIPYYHLHSLMASIPWYYLPSSYMWTPLAGHEGDLVFISGRLRSASGRLFDGIFNALFQTFFNKIIKEF